MSNIIAKYYEGILKELRSEVDDINTLFHHQGLKGEGNEAQLRELIKKFIPKRYDVGTGVVIDRHGNQSRQCDIVIYDSHYYPSLLSLGKVHFFPVDIVYATIEVKTTLTSEEAKKAIANIASVRKLELIPDKFISPRQQDGLYALSLFEPQPPLGFVFSYNSDVLPTTLAEWFSPSEEVDRSSLPVLVGCLDMGLILHQMPDGEHGPGNGGVTLGSTADTLLTGWIIGLRDSLGNFQAFQEPLQTFTQEKVIYPVKHVGNMYVPIDQSRVLLLFLLMLQEMLSQRVKDPSHKWRGLSGCFEQACL